MHPSREARGAATDQDVNANTATRYDRTRGTEFTGAVNRAQFRYDTDLDAWGEGLVMRRGGELFRATKGLAFERVAADADDARACVVAASDDGLHAAGIGPCNEEPTLTVLDEEHERMRPLALAPEDTPRYFVGIHGTHVPGARCTGRSGPELPCAPVGIDTSRGKRVALTLDGNPLPATLEGMLARDGTVTALLTPSSSGPEDAYSSTTWATTAATLGDQWQTTIPRAKTMASRDEAEAGSSNVRTAGSILQRTPWTVLSSRYLARADLLLNGA